MEKHCIKASLVIIANQHNPTVLSDSFLINQKIVDSGDEIISGSFILTPAFARVSFTNEIKLTLIPERLIIESNTILNNIYEKGNLYSKALPHIKCSAIGMNITYRVESETKVFDSIKKISDAEVSSVAYKLPYKDNETTSCNVNILKNIDNSTIVDFNYDYKFNEIPLKDIGIDFVVEKDDILKKSEIFIDELTK